MINKILINNMENPVGFSLTNLNVLTKFSNLKESSVYSIEISIQDEIIYNRSDISVFENRLYIDILLQPRTRYNVVISVEEEQLDSYFITGKIEEEFYGNFIKGSSEFNNNVFKKSFEVEKKVKNAFMYITATGLYETYINNEKVGNEFLTPGFTDYNKGTQVQTYDVTQMINKTFEWSISVGDGWYKGNLGFSGGKENIYGNEQQVIGEIHVEYEDGSSEVLFTDETFEVYEGKITKSSIYYGEDLDDTKELINPIKATKSKGEPLIDRMSVPIIVHEQIKPVELIITKSDEYVLDFGQNCSGFISFDSNLKYGQEIKIEVGEILQEGNFFRDNLRDARAAFTYISDGQHKEVRSHFTYFGFRYAKISGFDDDINKDIFTNNVLYSDVEIKSSLKTDNDKVNKLIENIKWGQKSNFIDVPTDCPQRDERLGWTGDAQIFSKTAILNGNVNQFFEKYIRDVRIDQKELNGMVAMYSPNIKHDDGGAAVWGDVITMLPWNLYELTGDISILKDNYQAMKDWISWIEKNTNNPYIWSGSFQFGDWLALDGEEKGLPTGKTDKDFIATVYYYLSVRIVEKVSVLLKANETDKYKSLADNIKKEFNNEYITVNGKLTIDTQTAYALLLCYDIVNEEYRDRLIKDYVLRLKKDRFHLKTGFVGTPHLCKALSLNNQHDLATKIFLNEGYPSWLYCVDLGATTIWERWNSVLSDGSLNPEGMNSLNHYSYGAILEWGYEHLLGIRNIGIGFDKVLIKPGFQNRMKSLEGNLSTRYGDIKLKWNTQLNSDNLVRVEIEIPLGVEAEVDLVNVKDTTLNINDKKEEKVSMLSSGQYIIEFESTVKYEIEYNFDTLLSEIIEKEELWQEILEYKPKLNFLDNEGSKQSFGAMSLLEIEGILPFVNFSDVEKKEIDSIFKKY